MAATPRYDLPDDLAYTVKPVGVVRSPFRVHEGTPRQPGTGRVDEGHLVLRPGLQNLLKDLKGFSHVWVLGWFNYSRGWKPQVIPPRDTVKRGLFATRSPHRPNALALSVLEVVSVRGTVIRVRGLDLLDGTPILDIKPYLAYCDSVPEARCGWVDALPPDRPDHRDTRRDPSSSTDDDSSSD